MNKLIVSPSPHMLSKNTTSGIMLDVVIALFPALLVGIFSFGYYVLLVTLVCIASCSAFEYLTCKLMKRTNTAGDLSAVVTGFLLAFNLPPSMPLWMCVVGSFFAIVIVKQLFGGIGQNFANPAITARIILFVSFPKFMTTWSEPFTGGIDKIASATPLVNLNNANTLDLFTGNIAGCIGEVSAFALLVGGIYLVIRRVLNPITPIVYIGTVFMFTFVLGENPLKHILAGGLMLGAIFMASDYSTTPSTNMGKLIFGIGCGVITVLIRVFGTYPEGVSFAILFMNLLTPPIDRITRTKPFGKLPQPKKSGGVK